MEVATTNNHGHSQSHHHHHHNLQATHRHHQQLQPSSEGVTSGSRSPFQREVREWQRVDPNTGALFSGRLEADRWIDGPLNNYGKKSSSSISSQSSNNSNFATAAAASTPANNTHRKSGKISLHAIVGSASTQSQSQSSSSSSITTATSLAATSPSTSAPTVSAASTPWHKWLAEQPDLYGKSNISKIKALRVGVIGNGSVGADAVVGTPTHRRDLESFRHYNNNSSENFIANDNDDDLRLSVRHQRRQQVSQSVYAPPVSIPLQRSRSISTDDLSNDWERQQSDEEPGEWRRVSKLRRSFQSQDYHSKVTPPASRRPLDLPSNSVSVARMRAELENGRRLNTAMRNNNVDLAALDNILNTPAVKPVVAKRNTFLTAESLQEIRGKLKKLSDENLYKDDFLPQQVSQADQHSSNQQVASAFRPVLQHTTHSLESRQNKKDTSSSEWHLRRKSYGFENMSPPEDKSFFRVDASTDSGLGRSGEQLGNWSPTDRNGGGTIIHFGSTRKQTPASPTDKELNKRHSIAVEETWRDVRKTSQMRVNRIEGVSTTTTGTNLQQRSNAQKRVEFCKTEVHFAAESGRVNIVETDGKPPPTHNFRRRRRTSSGPLQSLVKSASTVGSNTNGSDVTHFGDDPQRRKTIASSTVAYRATLMETPELVSHQPSSATQVTVTTAAKSPEHRFTLLDTTSISRNSCTSTSGVDTTDNETDDLSNIRGILKNKPIKPKPYHLGENIDSADVLWSIPASVRNERESPLGRDCTSKSVAERIRMAEQRQLEALSNKQQQQSTSSNYSTKINLSLGAEDVPARDLPESNVMNIALRAPIPEKAKTTPPTLRIGQLVPVAKPRTLFVQQHPVDATDESGKEALKIVKEARGARKLREHELSYFGVQSHPTPAQTKINTTHSNPRRTLPTRNKHTNRNNAEEQQTPDSSARTTITTKTTKWQLLNDRPDLLRHSPHDIDLQQPLSDFDEHCYENIANELTTTFRVKSPSPNSYERKTDLLRDAQILSEMTRNADQTLKSLSDEAAFKDQRRRSTSLQRRSAKPLETIDEKVLNTERQAPHIARGTFASEARRNSRQSTPSPSRARSSSQSSIEFCPRARSRSLSSEREQATVVTRTRSSSRESMPHGGGSSDEQTRRPREEHSRLRTPKREKTRHNEPDPHRHGSQHHSNSSAGPKRSHHTSSRSSHRDPESSHMSTTKHSSGARLVRSVRVSEESRPRVSSHRGSDRSQGNDKRREESLRSRGHSSRSRQSEPQQQKPARDGKAQKHSHSSSARSHTNETTSATSAHKKSTTTKSTSTTKATHHKANHHQHTTQPHSDTTHGKNSLNGRNHHHHSNNSSGGKLHGTEPQHHVHNLTTSSISVTKQQRERHGKDRK